MSKEQENIIKRLKFYLENGVGSPLSVEDYKEIIKTFEDLELYKKAFEISVVSNEDFGDEEKMKKYYLDQARKELNNEH